MGRAPCCDKANLKRGPWSPEEDAMLKRYIESHGTGGLKRCGKSCRLRWLNYLRPNIKHGGFTEEEDDIICTLYSQMGSRWSVISSQLRGRTDNDVKNYWNTKLKKRYHAAKSSISIKSAIGNVVPNNGNDPSLPCLPPSPQYSDPKAVANTVAFSDYSVNGTSVTLPTFYGIGYEAVDPQRLGLSPFQFSFPGVMDVPEFCTCTMSSHIVSSSDQEGSSISASSFAMDSKCLSFLCNGSLDDIGMLTDTQNDFARDIAYGFPLQDKTNEVALSCYLAELGYIRPQVPGEGVSNHY